jgi:hypothetical protein
MDFFEQRNRKVSNLNLLADSLSHSIREGVRLFSVDDVDSVATFVTESGQVIQGQYYFGEKLVFDNIVVESGEVFSDEKRFEEANRARVSSLIESIYSDDLVTAADSFDDIIQSWGTQLKFNKTVDRLTEQAASFNATFDIVGTTEFQRFLEVSENISKWMTENKESLAANQEITHALRLSDTVSRAFNLDRMSLEQLSEKARYEVDFGDNRSIYEMVCQQELVSREILESKKSFDQIWVSEPKINALAEMIFSSDEKEIQKALVEAVAEVPYLSLISKKQLSNTVARCLNIVAEDFEYTKSDLKDFVATLFEMKKPLKELIGTLLSEKYGVNINNLKEAPTFRTLLNTQSLIFECLAKEAPRGSIIRESLTSMAAMLKGKNGVQAIDVNSGLRFLFTESGFDAVYQGRPVSDFALNSPLTDSKEDVDFILAELYDQVTEEEKKEKKKPASKSKPDSGETEEEDAIEEEGESVEDFMKKVAEIEDIINPTDISEE